MRSRIQSVNPYASAMSGLTQGMMPGLQAMSMQRMMSPAQAAPTDNGIAGAMSDGSQAAAPSKYNKIIEALMGQNKGKMMQNPIATAMKY